MDARVKQEQRFLPALAEAIGTWFPELGGRSMAVSDVTITKENVPTLPLAMTAFVQSAPLTSSSKNSIDMFEIGDDFIVEFWLEPARYKKANGSETPFWSYYPYEEIRDTLLSNIFYWSSNNRAERISYRGLTISADQLSVALTFAFRATFRWCSTLSARGEPFTMSFGLCTPKACVPDACYEDEEVDPCHPCK